MEVNHLKEKIVSSLEGLNERELKVILTCIKMAKEKKIKRDIENNYSSKTILDKAITKENKRRIMSEYNPYLKTN